METQTVTSDILILRESNERAVLVRGDRYATAIDLPLRERAAGELARAAREMTGGGIRWAILTEEPEQGDLPIDKLAGGHLFRADRKSGGPWQWDVVPPNLLRYTKVAVHLVRHTKTVFDDCGRSFRCEPEAARQLAVRIQPDDVLVVPDDIHPTLPPRVRAGDAEAAIRRFETWVDDPPKVLIPASGMVIEGPHVPEVLDRSLEYLRSLRRRIRENIVGNRYPWERMVHFIHWTQHWPTTHSSATLIQRHRDNVRDLAEDVNLTLSKLS